jgi:hypothetical protein
LGPDPPLAKFIKFIEIYRFFTFLGPSIEPGKPSPKSASTANPPSEVLKKWKKVKKWRNLDKIGFLIIYDPGFLNSIPMFPTHRFLKYYINRFKMV